jgi:hypothetical protein
MWRQPLECKRKKETSDGRIDSNHASDQATRACLSSYFFITNDSIPERSGSLQFSSEGAEPLQDRHPGDDSLWGGT